MADLLPCPFCGKDVIDPGHADWCPLYAVGLVASDENWNRRQPYLPPEDVETLRMLEMALCSDIVDWTPERDAIRAIIARLEGKP